MSTFHFSTRCAAWALTATLALSAQLAYAQGGGGGGGGATGGGGGGVTDGGAVADVTIEDIGTIELSTGFIGGPSEGVFVGATVETTAATGGGARGTTTTARGATTAARGGAARGGAARGGATTRAGRGGITGSIETIRRQTRFMIPFTPVPTEAVATNLQNRLTQIASVPVLSNSSVRREAVAIQVAPGGVVTLTGRVANPSDRLMLEYLIALEPGVEEVDNRLEVDEPAAAE